MATIESAALELTSLMRNVCESVVEQTGARLIETIHARNNYIMELEGRLLTMDSALVTAERDLFTARSAIGDLEKERDAMLQKKQMKKEKRDAEKREMKKENETSPKESPPVQMVCFMRRVPRLRDLPLTHFICDRPTPRRAASGSGRSLGRSSCLHSPAATCCRSCCSTGFRARWCRR